MAATATGFMCLACEKYIQHRASMKRHIRDAHLRRNVAYRCPSCPGCVLASRNTFQNHVARKHPELRGIDFDHFCVSKDS